MAFLNTAVILLVLCVAFTVSLPRRTKTRLEILEQQVEKLAAGIEERQQQRAKGMKRFKLKEQRVENRLRALESARWSLHRITYRFPSLQSVELQDNMVIVKRVPTEILSEKTRAVLVSITCDLWKEVNFHPKMSLAVKQKGNKNTGATVYYAPMNDFYYEAWIPWDNAFGEEISITVKGKTTNVYSLGVTGYTTA